MKRKVVVLLLLSVFVVGVVGAATLHGTFEGNPIAKVFSNGRELTVNDVPAMNYNGRVMVPIYMLRELGLDVTWNQNNQAVSISGGNQSGGSNVFTLDELNNFADYIDVYRYLSFVSFEISKIYSAMDVISLSRTDYQLEQALSLVDNIDFDYLSSQAEYLYHLPIDQADKNHIQNIVSNVKQSIEFLYQAETGDRFFSPFNRASNSLYALYNKYDPLVQGEVRKINMANLQ